mgnify:CR=1 FL=1
MSERKHCPWCRKALLNKGYATTIGVEIQGLYDGVAYFMCPFCEGAWSRQGTKLTKQETCSLTVKEIFTK